MAAPVGQANWRFCTKCFGLFFNAQGGGRCPAGGGHSPAANAGGAGGPASWDYILIADPVLFPGNE